MTTAAPPKPKPKKKPPPRKRKPQAKETIRLMTMGPRKATARITFSNDLMLELIAMYDKIWFGAWPFRRKPEERYKYLRLQFVAFHKLGMPGCFVRLRPPLKDHPPGTAITKRNQRFAVQITCRKLGLRPGAGPRLLDYAVAPREFGPQGGIVIWFDDDDCKMPPRRELLRNAKKKDMDLVVR